MRYLLLFALLLMQCSLRAQQPVFGNNATIYLVRHGEKLTGSDPMLTPAGNQRAGDLLRSLNDKGIQRIYVTGYKRTQQTGDSVRLQLLVDTVHYLADTLGVDLVNKIAAQGDLSSPILVIGHSNTLPFLIRKLGITNYPTEYIPDNEYDNLFVLRFNTGKAVLSRGKFGAASGASAKMQ